MSEPLIDYYANPYFDLLTLYHIMGPFSFILNSFGLYMVAFKTSKTMGEYRIHLLIHLSIGAIFEFYVCFLCCPKLYTPRYMGSTHGFLSNHFGVSTFYQQWICFILIGFLLASCGELSHFRANSILINGTCYKLSHSHFICIIAFLYFLILSVITFTQFMMKNEQNGIENAKEFLVDYPIFESLHSASTMSTLYLVDKNLTYGSFFLILVSVWMLIVVFWNGVSCAMMVFQIYSKLCSRHNAKKIKRYLLNVQLQISPCVICYLLPCCWLASCLVFNIEIAICQVLNDLSCYMTQIQSPLSMLVLFYINTDYRNYLFNLFGKKTVTTGNVPTVSTMTAIRTTVRMMAPTSRS